jgi:fatty acid-binding protein DegV
MLGVRPFLSIEDGEPVIIEKVKSRSQGIDRIIEFLGEFDTLDDAMIVQNRTQITEQTRSLQDRLSLEFPGRHFPYSIYCAALAVLLGGDVTGVVVLETEIESLSDAF